MISVILSKTVDKYYTVCYIDSRMGLFRHSESFLGIDIGAGGIKLVELRKSKGRPQLWTYGILEETLDVHAPKAVSAEANPAPVDSIGGKKTTVPPDPRVALYAEKLRLVVEASRAVTRQATASLPVSQVFHAVMNLPPVPEKEIEREVRLRAAKVLPKPIEEMQVVHQILPRVKDAETKDIRLLVTAAEKRLVRFYTDIFAAAGLALTELETEAFAIERSLVGRDTATVMVVDIGAERTNFFIMDNGAPMSHRSIVVGGRIFDGALERALGIDAGLVPQIKRDLASTGADDMSVSMFAPAIDPIIKEIQYGIDLYSRQTGNGQKRVEKIILSGGSALFPPILKMLREAFPAHSQAVFVGDPWARVVYQQGLKPVLNEIGPRMAVAIGLALRRIVP